MPSTQGTARSFQGWALAAVVMSTLLLASACGNDDIGSTDIGQDVQDTLISDTTDDVTTDLHDPKDSVNDSSDANGLDTGADAMHDTTDTVDPGDAPDAGDAVEDEMETLFPGIREECRPADLGCTTGDECGGETLCIAGGCRPLVSPADFDFGIVKVVSGVRLPPPDSGSGFDMNGDGEPDNVLVDTIGLYPGGIDLVNNTIHQYMNAGLYTYLASFLEVPSDGCGPLRIAVLPATGDIDSNGLPDGSGLYQALPSGFRDDGHGPLAQINIAAIDGNLILTGPGEALNMKLPLPDGTILDIPVEGVRIQANIDLTNTSRLRSETFTAQLGGYVRLASVVDEVNRQAQVCACAGVVDDIQPAELVFDAGVLTARCIQSFDDQACSEATDGKVCSNLTSTCVALMLMSTLVDVTSGKTKNDADQAVPDALSLSIYVDLAPAELAVPTLAPDFGAIPDSWRNIPEADIAQDYLPVRLGVLINDYYDPTVDPLITAVTQGDAGGQVAVGADGRHIVYTPLSGFYGFDHFSYTISDPSSNTATASVEVRLSTFGSLNCDSEPQNYCERFCMHESTCDPDKFGPLTDLEDCINNCYENETPVMYISSDCGRAHTCMEHCRVNLPCTMSDEFDQAMNTLKQGGELTEKMPCGEWIQSRVQQCGECDPGTFGESCAPCPFGADLICSGIAECDDGTEGSGSCICGNGQEYLSGDCVDIDECAIVPPVCGSIGHCFNRFTSHSCYCPEGYVFDPGNGDCVEPITPCDPNPCLQDLNTETPECTLNAVVDVGFECHCREMYVWDGEVGACRTAGFPCGPNLCERDLHSTGDCFPGEEMDFSCSCAIQQGYFWNWELKACVDPCQTIDCAADPNSTGVCTVPSVIGMPECVCNDNYNFSYILMRCWDPELPCGISPCSLIENAVADSCTSSSYGSFDCDCETGWSWDGSSTRCTEQPPD